MSASSRMYVVLARVDALQRLRISRRIAKIEIESILQDIEDMKDDALN